MEYYPPGGALSSGPLSATDSDSWCKPPVTGGTSTALTVTDTRIGTPADHQTFRFKMNQDCGTAPYLAVNGGTSLQLCYKPAGSYLNFNSGELPNGAIITARYLSAYGLYVVEEWIDVFGGIKRFPSRLTTSDMPAIIGGGSTTVLKLVGNATDTITDAQVGVYSASHSTKAGALDLRAGPKQSTANGTWTPYYSLSAGAHHGDLWIYDSNGASHCRVGISSTTLGAITDNADGINLVDAGSISTTNIGIRINSGSVELNVGTSVSAPKLGIIFKGIVV